MIDEEIKRDREDWIPNPNGIGGKSHKTIDTFDNIQDNNIPQAPTGTSRQAGLRRLRKSRPDLYEFHNFKVSEA